MLGPKMKSLRLEKRLTLEELADTLNKRYPDTVNFNKGKLSKWENSKEEPKLSSIRILADFYDIKIDDFYTDETVNSSIEKIYNKLEPLRQKKVYNFAETQLREQNKVIDLEEKRKYRIQRTAEKRGVLGAGLGVSNYYEDISDESTHEWDIIDIPSDAPINFDWVYIASGDSMEPEYKEGDIVYCKEIPEVERSNLSTDKIYVIRVNGSSYLKKIRVTENGMYLVSLNSKYEDMLVTEDDTVKVVGEVVK
ncbi:XRE family transcriptional regulator [Enterococcus sp. AZ163]|uniref:XRE family transcriptional regulator n=1 Tax=Enterococcus sp. AZ163 TaxID=2774638 RepID=UPI003D266282